MSTSEVNINEIVIAMPSLGMTETRTFMCLMKCMGYTQGMITVESTLLPWGRNSTIQLAYKFNPNFTHLMFIDDDMAEFDHHHIQALVERDVDIVSAVMTHRKPPFQIVNPFPPDKSPIEYLKSQELIEVPHIGMAFTVIKRHVLDLTREQTPQGPIWFTTDRVPRDGFEDEIESFVEKNTVPYLENEFELSDIIKEAILFGQMSHVGSILVGEDVAFCRRLERLGIKRHVDCAVHVGHIGTQVCNVGTNIELAQKDEAAHAQNEEYPPVLSIAGE